MKLYQELDIVAEIKKAKLRWLGHVERRPEDRVIKKLYMSIPEYNRYRCRFPGAKARPRRDADHSPPSSAEVDNE
jgi:hypothetical protein